MKNNILVALNDLERPSELSEYGTHLGKTLERPVCLFSITKVPLYTPPVITDGQTANTLTMEIKELQNQSDVQLNAICLAAKTLYQEVTYSIDIGFTEPTILEKAEKQNPHLVVLEGQNELSTVNEWFGTYETRLAESTSVPALVVPKGYPWKPVNKVLYIMDMNDEKVENMRYLSNLCKELRARLIVVTLTDGEVNDNDERYLNTTKTFRELLGYDNIEFQKVYANDLANATDRMLEKTEAGWLAFEHKDRSFLERMMDSYNTKHLILQSDKPVLVF
ncbi:MAG: hypothetical protein AB8F74_08725 [Saprospiraceae bacterium]